MTTLPKSLELPSLSFKVIVKSYICFLGDVARYTCNSNVQWSAENDENNCSSCVQWPLQHDQCKFGK